MKRILSGSMALLILTAQAMAQNVGIGTSTPVEKLDVNGGLKIANSNAANPGTIRYNAAKNDFEGYNGKAWVSLTGGKSAWGSQTNYSHETDAANYKLNFINTDSYGKNIGRSLSQNGIYLVAGAPYEVNNDGNSSPDIGKVIYYFWTNNSWQPYGHFMPQTYSGNERVGFSVSHGGNRIAAGAPGANINGTLRQGRVLILPPDPSGGLDFQSFSPADGAQDDNFGWSVSVSGNYVLAGAPQKKVGANNQQGKAYIFQPLLSTWVESASFTAPDGATGDNFGKQVAIDGSYAAIAAPNADGQFEKAGKVYLFQRNGATWSYMTTLVSEGGHDFLGAALHLKNDTLIVGAPENGGGLNDGNGRVRVYVRSGNNWTLQATIIAPDAKAGDAFGSSVHRYGNLLIVGAPQADVGANDYQGKAYVYRLTNGSWLHEATLAASNGEMNDYFGMSVVITSVSAVVGAPAVDLDDRINNGEIYFFKY